MGLYWWSGHDPRACYWIFPMGSDGHPSERQALRVWHVGPCSECSIGILIWIRKFPARGHLPALEVCLC